ncbi:hypothetical protein [Wenjunlia tyrosinilytica]|uniref:Uncharacterized protein n=1 Tax=Wenjunlia tyrosinilytica TaxID=1544741 RepID=A0A917ZVN9_9ACTN|nr:hypothetical protein [Wenjunlia tyrosinilytica]GGO97866.1 hypothetical protein GCM10012280_60660 [Wenjunlia tyrosinilytica]
MPLFSRHRGIRPRLAPELDDTALGRVLGQVEPLWSLGQLETVVDLLDDVVRDTGQNWDRKGHRLKVLAESVGRIVPGYWRRHHPGAQAALLLHAWSDVVHARSQGSPCDLSETRKTCLRAAELVPDDPNPWTVLLAALRLERRPNQEMAEVWREIKARDTWNREAHLQALGYLSPQECGSTGLMMDLVDGVRAEMPADAPTAGLEVTAIVRGYQRTLTSGGLAAVTISEHWSRPDAAQALGVAATHWTTPGFLTHAAAVADLNVLAYALVKAARTEEAGRALHATQGIATPWPWNADGDPLEQFTYWRSGLHPDRR